MGQTCSGFSGFAELRSSSDCRAQRKSGADREDGKTPIRSKPLSGSTPRTSQLDANPIANRELTRLPEVHAMKTKLNEIPSLLLRAVSARVGSLFASGHRSEREHFQ